ncbi:hypothetical protein EYC59_04040 [Candidatus Saccharibacteria bacterium]|nr:MAG: hypothetical protein EYC59_04040 [Candidatus Saccharibacteria bacterium]
MPSASFESHASVEFNPLEIELFDERRVSLQDIATVSLEEGRKSCEQETRCKLTQTVCEETITFACDSGSCPQIQTMPTGIIAPGKAANPVRSAANELCVKLREVSKHQSALDEAINRLTSSD